MGQYYYTVNLTKREFIDPHKIGQGLKLREQCGDWYGTPQLLFLMLAVGNGRGFGDIVDGKVSGGGKPLACSGRWAGDQIAVIGDYAKDIEFPGTYLERECQEYGSPYQYVAETFEDITDEVLPDYEAAFGLKCEDPTSDGWRSFKKVREV